MHNITFPSVFLLVSYRGLLNVTANFHISWLFQVDLEPEDVFMLDVYDSIYLWIGKESREDEVEESVEAAIVSVSRFYIKIKRLDNSH